MNTLVTDFDGNSNIGLYGFVNDNFLLLGSEVSHRHDKELKEVFNVPIHRITIAGTSLIGVFVAGNNDKILVPGIIFEEERKVLEELGIDFEVYDTKFTCLGNNLKVFHNRIIINPEYSDAQARKIGEVFGVEAEKRKIAGLSVIGNLIVVNSDKKLALISNETSDDELKKLENDLGLTIIQSSVNMGSQFIGSGILCNKNGFAIGKSSGSPEILNAETNLGFIE